MRGANQGDADDQDDLERRFREIEAEFAAARKAQSKAQGRARRRGRARSVAITAAVVAGALGIVGLVVAFKPFTAGQGAPAPVTHGPLPTVKLDPPASSAPALTAADPFAGSPAAGYADGAAGIVLPAAHAVGPYTRAQVEAAYQKTRQMIVAAHLNGPTLRGAAPNAFAGLLIGPERTDFVRGLDKIGLTASGFQRSTRAWTTSFAPGTTQLVGNVIKVHGTMSATTGRNGVWHVLQIRTDYLFVYPVQEPGQPATLMRVVAQDVVDVHFAAYTDPGGALEPWWEGIGGGTADARCDVNDGFVHPQFPQTAPDKVHPSGMPVNPYALNTSRAHPGCQANTGT